MSTESQDRDSLRYRAEQAIAAQNKGMEIGLASPHLSQSSMMSSRFRPGGWPAPVGTVKAIHS
jgi:hypothetical protein